MQKDLRDREALRGAAELSAVAALPAFDSVTAPDLRRLAELIASAGGLDRVTIEGAASFGGPSRHRLECARRALCALVGEDHPSTRAVAAALSALQHGRRQGTHHRDYRTREAILAASWWTSFRALPGAATAPLEGIRAVDRYLAFCAKQGLPGGETRTFLAFVEDKKSSMLLRTLRDGLQAILGMTHPAIMAAEEARSKKEDERLRRRKPEEPRAPKPPALKYSVAAETLPSAWREIFARLHAGRRVRGRKYRKASVTNMLTAVRQLLWAGREAGLPDAVDLDTVRAYDAALEARGGRASSREIHFDALRAFGALLDLDQALLDDLQDLVEHYRQEATMTPKLKEGRLADLPELRVVFDTANALLDKAETTTDRRELLTLYVDGAALPFLSLIPLRNQDTVLRWGIHITHIGDDDPSDHGLEEHGELLAYYLDLRTSKTDTALSGPLAPILNPFLDALILQGRDARLLPQLRREAMAARSPVFPKTGGGPRGVRSLSKRWRVHLGTGSCISRTRIHTLLGALGAHGVRAALALCAQRSPRTAKWYQADALGRRRMLESQEMIAELVEMSGEDAALLAAL